MPLLDRVEEKISQKMKALPEGVRIITPEDGVAVDAQADWLISLLKAMYTQHGITKRRDSLIRDIESGNCKVWFAADSDQPFASAALVKQANGSTEVGRAVSLKNGVGGLLMLMAARDHLSASDKPLVAEVRIAGRFKGVPSGEATQTICFGHLELLPHASVPAFNHGDPIRQETFLFSSSQPLMETENAVLPNDQSALELLGSTAIALASSRFHKNLAVSHHRSEKPHTGWEIAAASPFSVMVPNGSPAKLETALQEAEEHSAFTLVPVEAAPESSAAIIECLSSGFVPCGIDSLAGAHGHPVLLLGKIRPGTLLAPTLIVNGLIPPQEETAIQKIDNAFRH